MAVLYGDVRTAAAELEKEFDYLSSVLVNEIKQADVDQLRLLISIYFYQEGQINQVIEGHLSRIEDYNSSIAVWNYFIRQYFIGYINYSLVKVFQQTVKSPLLTKLIEEYEKDYRIFLELSFMDVHNAFQQCPDLTVEYPVGIPKFKIHLQSEWDGKTILELREFLERCRLNRDDIDQLMIVSIEQS